MKHIYDLTILNCVNAVTNIFENKIEPLKTASYELKKHIRTITKGNYYPQKNIDITAYTYLELLSGYFYKVNSNVDFDTINQKNDDYKNLETTLKNEGFDVNEVTPEKLIKILTTNEFYLASNYKENEEKFEKLSIEQKAIYSSFYLRIVNVTPIPYKRGYKLYFTFLFLLIVDYGIEYTYEILEFHYQKSIISKLFFVDDLKIQTKLIPKLLQDDLIIAEIKEWISKKPNRNYEKIDFSDLVIDFNPEISNKDTVEKKNIIEKEETEKETEKETETEKEEVQTGLQTLFTVENWEKYIDVFFNTVPQILNFENGKYHFIGANNKHKGVIAAWIKTLHKKGIIKQKLNNENFAEILSKNIVGFSASPSLFNKTNYEYDNVFSKKLEKLLE